MGKLLKILGIVFGILVLLIITAVIVVPILVDPNDYKDEIVTKVEEQTGRVLSIGGDLDLSVFPWLGIEIADIEVSNAPGFEEKPFAAIRQAAVHVKLMPLISKEVEIDSIALDGLTLNLARSDQGVANWEDLAEGGESPAEPEAEANSSSSGPGGIISGLSIGGINISNAKVSWDDRSTGNYYEVSPFNLQVGAVVPNQPVDLAMDLALVSKAPQMNAKVTMNGTVLIDEQAGEVSITGLKLSTDAEGEPFPSGRLSAELQAAITAALNGDSVRVNELILASGALQLSGNLEGRNMNRQPQLSGRFELAEFNLREWMGAQGLSVPETADPAVLSRVGAGFNLNNQGDVTRLEGLSVVLDDTRLEGELSVNGPAIGFNLAVDSIDLDRYLPTPEEEAAPQEEASTATGDEPLFPIEELRTLDIDGVFTIGSLTIRKLLAEQIELKLKADKGRIETSQAVKKFYQGDYQGAVNLDVRGDTPILDVSERMSNLAAGPLVKDLMGDDKFSGTGQFNAKVNARGNSVNAIKQSLGGNLDFSFTNGAVKGFNLAQLIRDTRAKFKGQAVSGTQSSQQTDFSELSGSGVITNGVLSNNDLLAKSPYLRVTGKGRVDLVKESLDYTVTPVVVSTEKGQGGEGLDDLKGVPVPVRLTGAMTAPDYKIDWGKILVGTQKEKVKQKAQETLKDKLGDKLKGFF